MALTAASSRLARPLLPPPSERWRAASVSSFFSSRCSSSAARSLCSACPSRRRRRRAAAADLFAVSSAVLGVVDWWLSSLSIRSLSVGPLLCVGCSQTGGQTASKWSQSVSQSVGRSVGESVSEALLPLRYEMVVCRCCCAGLAHLSIILECLSVLVAGSCCWAGCAIAELSPVGRENGAVPRRPSPPPCRADRAEEAATAVWPSASTSTCSTSSSSTSALLGPCLSGLWIPAYVRNS